MIPGRSRKKAMSVAAVRMMVVELKKKMGYCPIGVAPWMPAGEMAIRIKKLSQMFPEDRGGCRLKKSYCI